MHPCIHAARNPDHPACVRAATGEVLSYGALEAGSNRSARLLRHLGFARGDVLAVLTGNSIDVFPIAWAAQRSGLYFTSISNKLTAKDVAYILADSGAKALIASEEFATLAIDATRATPGASVFLLRSEGDGAGDWSELCKDFPATRIDDEMAGADMLYSSGTTGRPKGVRQPLPQGDITQPTALTRMAQSLYGMSEATRYLSTSPLYHAAPLRWALAAQRLGATCVIMDKFDAETALALIDRYRITHSTWVPTHFVRLLKLPPEVRARYDLSSMQAAVHAAAPCPAPIKRAMIDWWGPIVHEYYSGTEGCGVTAISAEEWLAKPGSVGRAIVGEVKITDDAGQECAPDVEGLVYFANGPQFAYHNDPQKTAEAYNQHGWATLGDVGKLDQDGYLFLTDRKGFMIISGGVNIYPQEIENVLSVHPSVADVAVIGAPDEEMGERIVAVVQPHDWTVSHEALRWELLAYARRELGSLKAPREIEFRQCLPAPRHRQAVQTAAARRICTAGSSKHMTVIGAPV